jgi:hypothetical protein
VRNGVPEAPSGSHGASSSGSQASAMLVAMPRRCAGLCLGLLAVISLSVSCSASHTICDYLPPAFSFIGQAVAKQTALRSFGGPTPYQTVLVGYQVLKAVPVARASTASAIEPMATTTPGQTVQVSYLAGGRYIEVGHRYSVTGVVHGGILSSSVPVGGPCRDGPRTLNADGSDIATGHRVLGLRPRIAGAVAGALAVAVAALLWRRRRARRATSVV